MTATLPDLLNRIDLAVVEMSKLTMAATVLARSQFNAAGDDDEWTRYPKANLRCAVTGMGRSKIGDLVKRRLIRKKTVDGLAYFSARDWRTMMTTPTETAR
jgi:hypothetical protein